MPEELINKYRPQSFEEVLGHDEIVRACQRAISAPTRPHTFLLTGPSGVGKTTIARIIAKEIGAEVLDVDAASNSGIDAVRQLIELGQHFSLYGSEAKMFIIDEAHGLSKQALDALLKITEEPPAHLYFALCTTAPARIPETLVSRSYHIPLRRIKDNHIEDLLLIICDTEGWNPIGDVLQVIVQGATGQPRKAISLLQSCHDAPTRDEARRIISLLEASEPTLDLARMLVAGKKSWIAIRPLLAQIDDSEFEEASIQIGRYIISAMLKENEEKKAAPMWGLLEALVFPASTFDRKAAFVAAIGRYLWSN